MQSTGWKRQQPKQFANVIHLEEVEERDGINGLAEVWRVFKEEHASESGVDDVRVAA